MLRINPLVTQDLHEALQYYGDLSRPVYSNPPPSNDVPRSIPRNQVSAFRKILS